MTFGRQNYQLCGLSLCVNTFSNKTTLSWFFYFQKLKGQIFTYSFCDALSARNGEPKSTDACPAIFVTETFLNLFLRVSNQLFISVVNQPSLGLPSKPNAKKLNNIFPRLPAPFCQSLKNIFPKRLINICCPCYDLS